jgi:hypothetical protein
MSLLTTTPQHFPLLSTLRYSDALPDGVAGEVTADEAAAAREDARAIGADIRTKVA